MVFFNIWHLLVKFTNKKDQFREKSCTTLQLIFPIAFMSGGPHVMKKGFLIFNETFFFKINSIYPLPVSGRAGRMRWPVCPLLYRPRLRCHSYHGTRFQTPVTAWTPGDPNYSSPVSHAPSPLASSHHPEWTIGIQGSTIRDLTRWKIRHVLICEWSRRTCAITCSGYHRQAENQKTYQNNGFDGQIDSWFTRRGFFIFCAVYPIQGAELSGIQHGSPGIIYNIILFMGNISATGSWRGRCC